MDSGGGYKEKRAIEELSEGLHMGQVLLLNLHSAQQREFWIPKILASYDNALLLLKHGYESASQPLAPARPASSRPESLISFGSAETEEFVFQQLLSFQQGHNVISNKRKEPTILEDQVRIYNANMLESQYKWKHTSNHGVYMATPQPPVPPPPQPPPPPLSLHRTYDIPITYQQLQLSPPNLHDSVPSSFAFSSSFRLNEDNRQLIFPDQHDDEKLEVYQQPFISPVSQKSKFS